MATLGNTTVLSLNSLNDITTSGTISGNGSGLTNLNASNISSGTLSADRLPASGVTAGQYKRVTVDAKGRVTAGDNTDANDNTTLSGLAYCDTAAGTAAKTATMPGFALVSGQRIFLRTTQANTATSGVTLSVNSTAAKTIKIGSDAVTNQNFPAGDYIAYYDGTN